MTAHLHPRRDDRSGFAAALFSAIFPGLGHVYLGHRTRALAWAVLPFLAVALLAGVAVRPAVRMEALAQLTSPSWLLVALGLNVLLLLYRSLAVFDAYRLARPEPVPDRRNRAQHTLSLLGLAAVVVGLSLAHLAIGRLNLAVYQAVTGLNSGDQAPVDPGTPPDGGLVTLAPEPIPSPSGTDPVASAPPTQMPLPSPTAGSPWDGEERLNILLIGADHRPGVGGYLTDTMIVASIDPRSRQVAMFSLPRDTSNVPLPPDWPAARRYANGVYPNKINSLYTIARQAPSAFPGDDAQRGFVALKGALGQLYGIDIKYHVTVDFEGFLDVLEAIGGATIDVQVPVRDVHYPADDGRGSLNLYIPPGVQHFDGREALAYARARRATSDFDRAERQQRVITSIARQTDLSTLLAPGRIEALFQAVRKTLRTDIPPELFPELIRLGQGVDLDAVRSIVFTPPEHMRVCFPCEPSGQYVLLPNVEAIRRTVREAFEP